MINRKLILPTESRIHGDVYVRFGGRYGKTYRRKATKPFSPGPPLLHREKEGKKTPLFCSFPFAAGGEKTERKDRNSRGSRCCAPRAAPHLFPPAYTRRRRRKSSMTTTRISPRMRRRSTMSIRGCRFSGCSTYSRPTCRKRVRNCGKSWKRKTAVLKSKQANSSTSSRWTG